LQQHQPLPWQARQQVYGYSFEQSAKLSSSLADAAAGAGELKLLKSSFELLEHGRSWLIERHN
jgi:hypothetical protein